MQSFGLYLLSHAGEASPLGDLASDAIKDEYFPLNGCYSMVRTHIFNKSSDVICINALVSMFDQYLDRCGLSMWVLLFDTDINVCFPCAFDNYMNTYCVFNSPVCVIESDCEDVIMLFPNKGNYLSRSDALEHFIGWRSEYCNDLELI